MTLHEALGWPLMKERQMRLGLTLHCSFKFIENGFAYIQTYPLGKNDFSMAFKKMQSSA
jgi:hypothetical protein